MYTTSQMFVLIFNFVDKNNILFNNLMCINLFDALDRQKNL